jgi:hypothetical protein
MPGDIKINSAEEPEPERHRNTAEPDLFRFRKPSREVQAQFCLASLTAGQLSGLVPQGHVTGAAMFAAALLVLGRHCIHRR